MTDQLLLTRDDMGILTLNKVPEKPDLIELRIDDGYEPTNYDLTHDEAKKLIKGLQEMIDA